MAPVYMFLFKPSSSSIISIALIFGAPVIDPPGKHSSITFTAEILSSSSPSMVDTRWNTVAYSSNANSSFTFTVPALHTLLKSLRSKSTIINNSALSFSLLISSSLFLSSSSALLPLGLVPFIGLVWAILSFIWMNLSGDELIIWKSLKFKYAEKGALLIFLNFL